MARFATARRITRIICLAILVLPLIRSGAAADERPDEELLKPTKMSENLIKPDRWKRWARGFKQENGTFLLDNGDNTKIVHAVKQWVHLDQTFPKPIHVSAWSKAEGVTGKEDPHYSIWLDIRYVGGEYVFARTASFSVGTHDWEKREIFFVPEQPLWAVDVYLMLRRHGGKAWFRDVELRIVEEMQYDVPAREGDSPAVAVLDFRDENPAVEPSPLPTAVAEMLSDDLSGYEGLRVVERMRVSEFIEEGNLQAGFIDAASLERAGKALAADTAQALKELKQNLKLPEKAALVWGSGTEGQKAWKAVLEPLGYAVHSASDYWLSGAHLAPYSLVVLVRQGVIP